MESLPHCQLASEPGQQGVRDAYLPMLCASLALSWVPWSIVVTMGLTLHAATSILGHFKSKKLDNCRKLQRKQKSLVIPPPIMNHSAFLWIFSQSCFWGICFYLIDILLESLVLPSTFSVTYFVSIFPPHFLKTLIIIYVAVISIMKQKLCF